MPLTIHAWTFDVGLAANSLSDYAESMATRVEQSYDEGADIVLFPEYAWASLLAHTPMSLPELARHVWGNDIPLLAKRLARPGKLVVLGTAPHFDETTRKLTNRAPILVGERLLTQDKLFLTPWEREFTRGDALNLIEFNGMTVAVVICLDIEIPELSARLRGQGVDLILVPSATETELGCERVTRCASARAVELGCAVVVSPLIGRCSAGLVDENVGRLAAYLPSQAVFLGSPRVSQTEIIHAGFRKMSSQFNPELIAQMRAAISETNPALILRESDFEQTKLIRHQGALNLNQHTT